MIPQILICGKIYNANRYFLENISGYDVIIYDLLDGVEMISDLALDSDFLSQNEIQWNVVRRYVRMLNQDSLDYMIVLQQIVG
jgi:hypothetical protein